MPKRFILLLFLGFCLVILPVCGQDIAISGPEEEPQTISWQEQILQQIDMDDLGSEAYNELLEELSELTVWSDTTMSALTAGRLRHNLIWSSNRCLNERAGYRDQTSARQEANKAYLGDPWHHSLRYRMEWGQHWQVGMNLEKDAGEAWRTQMPGFDSWHGFVRLRRLKLSDRVKLHDAVVGHYRLRMGSGLIINQGFSLGKQYMSQQLQQRSNQLTPFASNAESGYMQGMAADLRLGSHLVLLPYFSARQIDGTYDASRHCLTALQTDGYHRTRTEESHRQAAWQWISGARIGWRDEWFDVGLHLSYTHLQYDYLRSNLYYNQHYFRGHQLLQGSFDYTAHAFGGWLKGELAFDDHGALANITSLRYPLGDYWNTSVLYRYYDPEYHQLHARSLAESSAMQGEQGLTLHATGQLARHWQLQLMADYFSFSQPQYGIRDTHSSGIEASIRTLYQQRRADGSLGYRIKQKGDYIRHTFDGLLTLRPVSGLTCKTQLRARIYNERQRTATTTTATTSVGYGASQSVTWQSQVLGPGYPFTLEGQAGYFSTDDYDSRVYLTERAVLYGFGLPMLYGEGLRYSLTATIKIGPHLHVDLKGALTNYANKSVIASGLQQISGNTQGDLWLQVRWH